MFVSSTGDGLTIVCMYLKMIKLCKYLYYCTSVISHKDIYRKVVLKIP